MGVAILGSFLGNRDLSLHSMHTALTVTLPLYGIALALTICWIMPGYQWIKQPGINE
jgi:DHA2 family methylenomycin A resistance protein-like MFS transporter